MKNENSMLHGFPYAGQDVRGWLLSEKMNGCRAYWDGSAMWTRGGRIVALPETIRKNLPEGIELDGEINAGRGQAAFELARRAIQYGKWGPACVFSAFDAPDINKPFSARYEFLQYILAPSGPVNYVPHAVCPEIAAATALMLSVQSVGGEGVILRKPEGRYFPGRTNDVLKLKRIPHESPLSALR